MEIRSVQSSDYHTISPLINEWWGGRQMADMLPKLFFVHFSNTSFVVENNGRIVGFIIGFLSQTNEQEAYIHFVGVDPEYRRQNIGKQLYDKFFNTVLQSKRSIVRCVTSPVNKTSISYHAKIGFVIVKGDKEVDGISVHSNYDGNGQSRVLFVKELV